jgi:hypothetical protein
MLAWRTREMKFIEKVMKARKNLRDCLKGENLRTYHVEMSLK